MHSQAATGPSTKDTTISRPPSPATTPAPETPPDSRRPRALRLVLRVLCLAVLVWAIHLISTWLGEQVRGDTMPGMLLLLAILVAYALLIAVPFVPGVEIGVILLMMEGARVAPLVYLATLSGLMLSYLTGWCLPYAVLRRLATDLRLTRLAAWIDRIAPLRAEDRLEIMSERLPRLLVPVVHGQRYLLLGVLINLPGSSLIGGGGGLSLAAGLSRLYRPAPTLLTLAIAVAPVPVLVWFFDVPWLVAPA